MTVVFHAFEYLAYIIPGTVFLVGVFWLSPKLKAPLIEEKINLSQFGIFVVLAFVAGFLVHAVAHYFPEKWPLRQYGLVHRTDTLICSEQQVQRKAIRQAIGEKLNADMDPVCKGDIEAKQWVLRQIFADEHKSGSHHDRVELFEGLYYMMLDLSAAFILLIPLSIVLRPDRHLFIIVPSLAVAALLSILLTSYFDTIYASEVILSLLEA